MQKGRKSIIVIFSMLCCFVMLQLATQLKTTVSISTHSPVSTSESVEEGITSSKLLYMTNGDNWRKRSMVFKVPNTEQRFLTIGIPTVQRPVGDYFLRTLDVLLKCTTEKQYSEIFIVILLADFNVTWRQEMSNKIAEKYPTLLADGTLQVIEAPREFYPPLNNLNHTYNDPQVKRKWRSKQNIDYAFLWLYSKNLSQYYIQLEDDIHPVPGYIDIIKDFIRMQKKDWTCLEFSDLGFIGKLYPSKYLERLAKTVILFYVEQPVDVTYLYFNILNMQERRIIRRPTIFQHVGFHSSLPGKIQPLKDRFFRDPHDQRFRPPKEKYTDDYQKVLKGDNPPARILTTLKISPEFPPEMSYSSEHGYFWSMGPPKTGDTVHILFEKSQYLRKIIILSGSRDHPQDIMEHARLDACSNMTVLDENNVQCSNSTSIGSSKDGKINTGDLSVQLGKSKVPGLRLTITKGQHHWLIVREIAIFVRKK